MSIRFVTVSFPLVLLVYSSYGQSPAKDVHIRSSSYWSAYEGR